MKDRDQGLTKFGIMNMTIIKVVLASSQAGHSSVTHSRGVESLALISTVPSLEHFDLSK